MVITNPLTQQTLNANPEGCNQYTGKGCSGSVTEIADRLGKMSRDEWDNYDPYTGRTRDEVKAFKLAEARKLLPKVSGKTRSLKSSFSLGDEAYEIANVDGVPVLVTRYEDPDEPDDDKKFVYAHGEPWAEDENYTETTTSDLKELLDSIRRGRR